MVKKSCNPTQYKEVYGDFSEPEFVRGILNFDFANLFESNDPELIWDGIFAHIMSIVDRHCPVRKIKIPIRKPAYLTDQITALMNERNAAFRVARRTNTVQAWNNARTLHICIAKSLRNAKRK